jgi:hypothetical protein
MTKAEAEELLDWLDGSGVAGWKLSMTDDGFFVSCW